MSIASFYLNTDTYQVRFASAEAGRLTVSLGLAEETGPAAVEAFIVFRNIITSRPLSWDSEDVRLRLRFLLPHYDVWGFQLLSRGTGTGNAAELGPGFLARGVSTHEHGL